MMKANKFVVILASIAFGAVFAFGPTRSYEVVEKDPFGPSDWGLDPVDAGQCALENPWVFPTYPNQWCSNMLADIASYKAAGDLKSAEAIAQILKQPPSYKFKFDPQSIDLSKVGLANTKFGEDRCVDLNPWMSNQMHELHCREYATLLARAQKEGDVIKQKHIVWRSRHRAVT